MSEVKNNDLASHIPDSKITFVDFWAPCCGPCKGLTPILEGLEKENPDKMKLVKVNIEDNQELSEKFGIRTVPTIIVYKDGQEKQRIIGSKPKKFWEEILTADDF